MFTFVLRSVEGYEHLPEEIVEYLHNRWIHHELSGPIANLVSSWRGVEATAMFVQLDESYTARQSLSLLRFPRGDSRATCLQA